jgi:hypothetical protein
LQVFPTEVCKGFASKCPGGQKSVYMTGHINRIQSYGASALLGQGYISKYKFRC